MIFNNNYIRSIAISSLSDSHSSIGRLTSRKQKEECAQARKWLVDEAAKLSFCPRFILQFRANRVLREVICYRKAQAYWSDGKAPSSVTPLKGFIVHYLQSRIQDPSRLNPTALYEISRSWKTATKQTKSVYAAYKRHLENDLKILRRSYRILPHHVDALIPAAQKGDFLFQALLCERYAKNPFAYLCEKTGLQKLSSWNLNHLTTELQKERLNPHFLTPAQKQLLADCAAHITLIKQIIAHPRLQKGLSEAEIAFLKACAHSQLPLFRVPEKIDSFVTTVLDSSSHHGMNASTQRMLHPAASFKATPMKLSNGETIPFLEKLSVDLPRLPPPGKITLITPTGEKLLWERDQLQDKNAFLEALRALPAHQGGFDPTFNAYLQLFLSQEGFGLPLATALIGATENPVYKFSQDSSLSASINVCNPHKTILTYVYKVDIIDARTANTPIGQAEYTFSYTFQKGFFNRWHVTVSDLSDRRITMDPHSLQNFHPQEWLDEV